MDLISLETFEEREKCLPISYFPFQLKKVALYFTETYSLFNAS